MVLQIALTMIALNVVSVAMFWHDKRSAIAGARRISEADLLFVSMIGGSPGALLARRWFRHKTRKEPFSTRLMLIVAVQLGIALGLLGFDSG